jgi:hypothetical protein
VREHHRADDAAVPVSRRRRKKGNLQARLQRAPDISTSRP